MNRLKFINNLIILAFLVTISCKSDNQSCDHYYLIQAITPFSGSAIAYNSNAQIKTITSNISGQNEVTTFSYDQNLRLSHVEDNFTVTSFYYDSAGRLGATLQDHDFGVDSIHFHYDSIGRLRKSTEFENHLLHLYSLYSYANESDLTVNVYDGTGAYSGTFKYAMDNKKRPWPDEYYEYYISKTNILLQHNAITTSTSGFTPDPPSSFTEALLYNSRGYPVRDGSTTYTYSCTPPK